MARSARRASSRSTTRSTHRLRRARRRRTTRRELFAERHRRAPRVSWADLGSAALRAALPLAVWGAGAAAYAAAKKDGRALASARWSALLAFILIALAAV